MLKRMLGTMAQGQHGAGSVSSVVVLLLFASVPPSAATDYFVRQNGDDGAQGTSTSAAWRTIDRVNRARLQPGDRVLQYNDSHDNDGPGLMVYSYPYASHTDRGNVVRFNISENDARKGRRYAGLWVRTDGKEMTGVEIYNNTVVIGPWTDQAACVYARGVEARVRNNIFIATGPALPLRVEQPEDRVRFEGNLYWCEGGPTQIAWGAQTYASLREWRDRTGQESVNGEPTGRFANPALSQPPPGVRPGERRGLQAERAYRPRPTSPALAGGLDLRKTFGLDIGDRDLLGRPLAGRFPLGAIGTPAPD